MDSSNRNFPIVFGVSKPRHTIENLRTVVDVCSRRVNFSCTLHVQMGQTPRTADHKPAYPLYGQNCVLPVLQGLARGSRPFEPR